MLGTYISTATTVRNILSNDNEINLEDKQNRPELLKKDLKGINKKIETLADLAGDNRIDKETFSSRFEILTTRRDNISQVVPRLQGEIDFFYSEVWAARM